MQSPSLIPVRDVADRYGVSKASVVRAIQRGYLPAKKIGWIWVIEETQLPAQWSDLKKVN